MTFAGAHCIGVDPDLFFDQYRFTEAKLVCEGCPAQQACLDENAALPHSERPWGVWGGMTPMERKRTRRAQPLPLRSQ